MSRTLLQPPPAQFSVGGGSSPGRLGPRDQERADLGRRKEGEEYGQTISYEGSGVFVNPPPHDRPLYLELRVLLSRERAQSCVEREAPRNKLIGLNGDRVPAKLKLTDEQVKRIRRRVRAGELVIDLADEFGVNRKTIRRRLDALERAETEQAQRSAEKRLRGQAARERRKLLERERALGLPARDGRNAASGSQPDGRLPRKARVHDPLDEWLNTRKNLSGRALAEAQGLVRVRNPEGTVCAWRERSEIDALLEAGWQLA